MSSVISEHVRQRRVYTIRSRDGELKCGGCRWHVYNLFVLATSQEDAVTIYNKGEGGLCGACFSEMLSTDIEQPIIIVGKGGIIEVED